MRMNEVHCNRSITWSDGGQGDGFSYVWAGGDGAFERHGGVVPAVVYCSVQMVLMLFVAASALPNSNIAV